MLRKEKAEAWCQSEGPCLLEEISYCPTTSHSALQERLERTQSRAGPHLDQDCLLYTLLALYLNLNKPHVRAQKMDLRVGGFLF